MNSQQTETANPSRNELRLARMRAVVLATATLIAILGFTYGQIQRTESKKNLEMAKLSGMEAENERNLAEVAQAQASMLAQQLSEVIQSLEECQRNRK